MHGKNQAGMTYLIILFLLAIVSSMSLAFLEKSSFSTSVTVARGEGMQASYLAESAANHAMWRLLHEPDFPEDEDKYYMHSFAGGRYGYKVRRHTDTTFATIATVGAIGEHVVHQSYVLYVKDSGLTGGIYWLSDSDSKVYTPATNNWRDVDISADSDIPDGATGVILEIVNESNYSRNRGQVRANGSTDPQNFRAGIRESTQIMAFVKLDENKTFEAYRNSSDIKFYIRGYTGNDVTFFKNRDSFSLGAVTDTPVTIDLSGSGVPGDSIAILELYDGGNDSLGIRRKGDSDYTYYSQDETDSHQYIMVGVDSNSMFEYLVHHYGTDVYQTIRLVGYLENNGTWLSSPSADVSGTTTWSWVDRDITAQTSDNARISFMNIINDEFWSSTRRADLRANGSSDDQYDDARHVGNAQTSIFYVVGLDESQLFETKIEDSDIDIHILGYGE